MSAPYKLSADQEAWLRDLETTTEPQGKGYLHGLDGWCCLGRACVTVGCEGEMGRGGWESFEGYEATAPESVVNALRLRDESGGIVSAANGHCTLTSMNDAGIPFKEIAAFIRSNPRNVFLEEAAL